MDKETIIVKDHGSDLRVTFDGCIMYHGRDSIGGLALGFRIMHFALGKLCPDSVPEREKISFKTAFPGPGLRDAVEMVSRAVTRGQYEVLSPEGIEAPEGVYGKMYFEVTYGDKTLKLRLADGALSSDFIATGRKSKQPGFTEEEKKHWTELKENLNKTIWSVEADQLLNIVAP